jgi:hypothetical protein
MRYFIALLIFLITAPCFAVGPIAGVVGSGIAVLSCNTVTPWGQQTTRTGDYTLADLTVAQKLKISVAMQVCRVDVLLFSGSASARNVHIEFWPTSDKSGSQLGASSASTSIPATASWVWYTFTWASNYPNPSADSWMFFIDDIDSNQIVLSTNADPNSYEDTAYDVWNGSDLGWDSCFKVYTMQ